MSILYQDMAFHNGKVYAVANGGDLYEHEISEDSDTGEPRVSGIQRVMGAPAPPLLGGYLQVRLQVGTQLYCLGSSN